MQEWVLADSTVGIKITQKQRGVSTGFFESAAPTATTAPRVKRRKKSFAFIPPYCTEMKYAFVFREFM